tara:strand:+ start:255 stop:1292 length:1038 start_codon:yes stop_codon:yes gene_type:complete
MWNNLLQLSIKTIKILVLFLWISCNPSTEYKPELLKPNAKKDYGEILFAINKKYWENKLGKSIKNSFEGLLKTTPLPYEKEYKVDFIVPKKIINNLKNKSCIIFVEIEDYNLANTIPIYKKDMWAKNQLIIELKFKTEKNAIDYFESNSHLIKEKINHFYYSIISKKYNARNAINQSIDKEINLSYLVSNKMKLNKERDSFWWFSEVDIKKDQNGSHEIQKGIIIYQYPYYNQKQFEKNIQIKIRDSICKKHLRGKKNNSYMVTVKNGINQTISAPHIFNNKYFNKLSGCWRMENDKMGGAFISVSFLTKDKKNIITTEGYVYAPNFEKIKLIRELESIIYSPFI